VSVAIMQFLFGIHLLLPVPGMLCTYSFPSNNRTIDHVVVNSRGFVILESYRKRT
jgi:hypothetical protein